jgi:hypothetical protein
VTCARMLQKAERDSLMANSLSVQRELQLEVVAG